MDSDPQRATAPSAEERVRPCLECGTILPFDAEICSLCGERYATSRIDAEAVKPCMACDAVIPARHLFCPECGDFTLAMRIDRENLQPLGAREGRALQWLVRLLATATVAVAALLLVASVLELVAAESASR